MNIEMTREILRWSVDRSKSYFNQSNIIDNQNVPIGPANYEFSNPSQNSIKNNLEKL